MAETRRTKALQQLAGQFPAANQEIARGLESARKMQLQRQVAQAPTRGLITPTAQALGRQQAAVAGEISLATQQEQQRRAAAIGELGLKEQQLAAQERITGRGLGLRQRREEISTRIASLGEDVKNQILDNRLEFQRDESGRTYLNERKLADFAFTQARNEQDWKDYAQMSDQMHRRKIQVMDTIQTKLEQAIKQGVTDRGVKLDRIQKKHLAGLVRDMKKERQAIINEQRNKSAMWGAGLSVLLGGAGFAMGGPGGAALGMGAGQALGGFMAAQ